MADVISWVVCLAVTPIVICLVTYFMDRSNVLFFFSFGFLKLFLFFFNFVGITHLAQTGLEHRLHIQAQTGLEFVTIPLPHPLACATTLC